MAAAWLAASRQPTNFFGSPVWTFTDEPSCFSSRSFCLLYTSFILLCSQPPPRLARVALLVDGGREPGNVPDALFEEAHPRRADQAALRLLLDRAEIVEKAEDARLVHSRVDLHTGRGSARTHGPLIDVLRQS